MFNNCGLDISMNSSTNEKIKQNNQNKTNQKSNSIERSKLIYKRRSKS
jgi:hypothetical protein